MIINYAHRGASSYRPENTLCAFYLGWQMGANGIETDVQLTKDGILVLFHDDTLERIAGRQERICDLTWNELRLIDAGGHKGEQFAGELIPTFEEFLHHFGYKGLHLAIEIKQPGIEQDVIEMLRRYGCIDEHIVITSFSWDSVVAIRQIAPEFHTGYLCHQCSDELFSRMQQEGVWQFCPKAADFTDEWNRKLRDAGFSIRAWGVANEDLMHRMLQMGVDGMTVNFPDKLQAALGRTPRF